MSVHTCSSGHISLHKYMESYLIDPIHSLSYLYPLVIVVDALLDEWEHHEAFPVVLNFQSNAGCTCGLTILIPCGTLFLKLLKTFTYILNITLVHLLLLTVLKVPQLSVNTSQ